jgi:WS/DGAT/MGAT family acyltransferase
VSEGPERSTPLSPEDLGFWYADQARQRTTMAMLILLDRPPDRERLRAAAARAVEAVPRLAERVVDAPFDLALPRWEPDPTFDLDFHMRSYSLDAAASHEDPTRALFRTVGPIYERPFDRTRPLWEMIELDRPDGGSALFFRLHHAVADGVGGNAILAAPSDAERDVVAPPYAPKAPGSWPELDTGAQLRQALRRRAAEGAQRWRTLAGTALGVARDPDSLARAWRIVQSLREDTALRSGSPLRDFGRARRLGGFHVPFEPLRHAKRVLGGKMIDVLLTAAATAAGSWHRAEGHRDVEQLLTLAPINLRARADQGLAAGVGNRTTGIMVPLPIAAMGPLERFAEVRRRVEERKTHPSVEAFPTIAAAMATLPRLVYRRIAYRASSEVDLIVTNVPGVMTPRFIAGAEIVAAYPFAPVSPHCPVSIALYGYHGSLYVGLDADATAMPDLGAFEQMVADALESLVAATRGSGA